MDEKSQRASAKDFDNEKDVEKPSAKAVSLEGGYNQTYLIMAKDENNFQSDGEEVHNN